jgi:hypothetical protein
VAEEEEVAVRGCHCHVAQVVELLRELVWKIEQHVVVDGSWVEEAYAARLVLVDQNEPVPLLDVLGRGKPR